MARAKASLFDEQFLRRLEGLHLLAKRLSGRSAPGVRRARRLGDGLEFADHRDYAPGDDIRFMDWPYYARMEKLLLRMFHEHSEANVYLLLDVSASMAPGGDGEKFDYARRVAAALAYVAMGSLEPVTIVPFCDQLGSPIAAGRSRNEAPAVLERLGALTPGGKTQLGSGVRRFIERLSPQGPVVLISDLLDCAEELSDALARLRPIGETSVIQVFSPAEAEPTISGPVVLRQAESGQEVTVAVTPELLEEYRRRWQEFRSGCERTAVARGSRYVAASTAMPFETLVLETLRRAGVLG